MAPFKPATISSATTVLIRPSCLTPPESRRLPLSLLDWPDFCIFTPVLLLYPPQQGLDFPTLVARLKESLRKALVEFYPFAGRLVKAANGLAEVRCDDSGAFFTEAVVEQTLQEIRGSDGEGCVALSGMEAAKLSSEGTYSLEEHDELPTLVIQVTYFKCKSIALAVNWHHRVVDGAGGMSFLKAWSEVALGQPITNLPDHRRHLLSPRDPPQPRHSVPGFKLLSSHPQNQGTKLPAEERRSKEISTGTKPTPRKVVFTISASEISQLKDRTDGLSSGILISAHVWKLVTKARALERDATTTLYTVVDARKRLKDFPATYFGNCVVCRPVECSVADVEDMPVAKLARLVHESVSLATDEYVRSIVDCVHVTGASNLRLDRAHLATHDLQPTFWRFFPIYELDFGFGNPSYGGRNGPALGSTGYGAVSPTPRGDGSVAVGVFLLPDAARRLEDLVAPKSTHCHPVAEAAANQVLQVSRGSSQDAARKGAEPTRSVFLLQSGVDSEAREREQLTMQLTMQEQRT